ncbi:inner membrane protein YpjD [Bacteroidota bacterium]
MKSLSQILSYILPFLYLGVIFLYYLIFTGKKKNPGINTAMALAILLIIHAVEIITRNIALRTTPMSTAHDAFSFLAFSILFVYMIIELSLKNKGSGIFLLTLAFVFELFSIFNMSWEPETNPLLANPTFAIHASLSVMGYTAMAISAIYALMYIIQNRNIKRHYHGKLFSQLPAITFLEKMSIRSVTIGMILLGIGILLGHIEAKRMIGSFMPNDIKVIVTDLVWLIYLIGILLARVMRWRGRWMAYFALAGFVILILGAVLLVYLFESFHKFS